MTSQPIRDRVEDHLITPKNAALLLIDYQPPQADSIVSMDHRTLVANIVATAHLAKVFALPNTHTEEQDVIASDEIVAVRLVVSTTQTGDLLGIPASGRAVGWDAVDIYRVIDDGKISEQWAFEDMAAIGSQLGAFTLPWED